MSVKLYARPRSAGVPPAGTLASSPAEQAAAFADRSSSDGAPAHVLKEILSEPALQAATVDALSGVPLLPLLDGYRSRAGRLRAKASAAGHKTKIAGALIARCCLDHEVPLITNDRDFRHYTKWGLRRA